MSPERWQQIEPILDEALALPSNERSLFLDRACNGDASLRAEIETFFVEKSRASDFLEQPVFALPSEIKQVGVTTQPNTIATPLIGQQLGSYKIISLLGKGGMGEVYLARDTRLDREVAIKLLPPSLTHDPEREERFKREAKLQARLNNHQNIAIIHALEQSDDASFFVLEYVPGDTLADRLQQRTLKVAEALPLFRQIADALATAHQQGIIHRDLKPANIKITPSGQIKVLDFGLAKLLHHAAPTAETADALLTTRTYWTTGRQIIIGTVPYMSPEQTYGKDLDHRTDIWAFGCVLYEALAGKRPFDGFDTFDIFNAIRTREPDWQALPVDTPPALRKLLQSCLEKEPEQRLSSANEALRVIAAEETAHRSLLIAQLKRWKKQVAMVVVAALAITLGITYRQPIEARVASLMAALTPIPKDKTLIVLPFKVAGNPSQEDKLGRGLAKALQDVLASVTDLRVLPFAEALQANLTNATADRVMKSAGVNLVLDGEVKREGDDITIYYQVQNNRGTTIFRGEVKGKNNEYARLQNEIAATVTNALKLKNSLPNLPRSQAEIPEEYLEAMTQLQSDLTRETIATIIKSLEALREKEPESARVLAALSQAYFHKADLNGTLKDVDVALEFAEKSSELDPQAVESQLIRGQAWYFLKKYDEAIACFRAVREKQPSNLDAILGLAWAYEDKRQFKEAEQAYKIAVDFWPTYWGSHNELGGFYFNQKQYIYALQEWQIVAGLNPDGASGAINIGNAFFKLGRLSEAESAFRQALEKPAIDKQTITEAYLGLGIVRYYQFDLIGAERMFQEGITADPNSYLLWLGLGDARRLMTGRDEAADEAYQQALNLRQQREESLVGLARIAEILAKRSHLSTRTPAQKKSDQKEAHRLIQRALTEGEHTSEILMSTILVYNFLDRQEQSLGYVALVLKEERSFVELDNEPDLRTLRQTLQYQEITKPYR